MAISKEEWKQAFQDSITAEFAEVPLREEEIEYTFSEAFLKNMDKLVHCQKKRSWNMLNTAKKRVAMFAIMILALFMTACSIKEIRLEFMRWYEEVYGGFEHKFELKTFERRITNEYGLTVIPKGFKEVARLTGPSSRMTGYENEEGDYIALEQYATDELVVFKDSKKEYVVLIREIEVQVYEYAERVSAVWLEKGDCMILTYYGCEDVEDVKAIIETIGE